MHLRLFLGFVVALLAGTLQAQHSPHGIALTPRSHPACAPAVRQDNGGDPSGGSDPSGEIVIYDSLCIVDEGAYDSGYGAWCGGDAIFGFTYDLQGADDIVLHESCTIRSITADYLTFTADVPEYVCINFYRMSVEGRPEERERVHLVTDDFSVSTFDDTVFDLLFGLRVTARIEAMLSPGRWLVSMQGSNSDWGYHVGSMSKPPCGGNADHAPWLRDVSCSLGTRCCYTFCGGYALTEWQPSEEISAACTLSMRVMASDCVPAKGACCFPDASCAELFEGECVEAGGGFHFDAEACDVRCMCQVLERFSARCKPDRRLVVRTRFANNKGDGESILISIEHEEPYRNSDHWVRITGRRAVLRTSGFRGLQTVRLLFPDCGASEAVQCLP